MNAALVLLILQGLLGALDTLYYHEFRLRLGVALSARKELRLHAARDFLYCVIFGSLAWINWNGLLSWVLFGVLLGEVLITLWDFIEEDRSRKVPPGERSMHAIMGITYGAFLAMLLPEVFSRSQLPTSVRWHDYGLLSWLLTSMALGVFVSGLRDLSATFTGTTVRRTALGKTRN
jgi:hypothetical protein